MGSEGGIDMTEIKLEFLLEEPEIPAEVDRLLLSFLKASVEKYSPELFGKLYTKKQSVMKTYSDADMGELFEFFNAFQLMRNIEYSMGGNSMKLREVKAKKIPEIKESELIIKMQSSLLARKHDPENNTDIYYTCEDPEFSDTLKDNLKFFLNKIGWDEDVDCFSIVPVKGQKIVAKVWGRPTNASIGIYKLQGTPRLLDFLYSAGLGSRRSEGHGKWEIVW